MNDPSSTSGFLDDEEGLRFASRAVLATQLSLVISDARVQDHPLVWVNDGFCALTGYRRDEALGRNCRFLQGPGTDPDSVAELAAELAAGRTAQQTLLNYRSDGTPFWSRMVISPVRDADGTITHHFAVQTDVTDQVMTDRARVAELELMQNTSGRLELLTRVGDALTERLNFDEAADLLADIAVPPLATWGFVALLDDRGGIRRVHVAATDPGKQAAAEHLSSSVAWLTGTTVNDAIRSDPDDILMPMVVDRDAMASTVDDASFQAMSHLGLGSWMTIPLFARDRVLGVLVLAHDRPDGFGVRAVVAATHLGRRAGLALDNVRLYRAERDSALTLQHRLLPRPVPVEDLDVSASYLPSAQRAEVGGDWFDVLPLPGGGCALTIGDIVGHDIAAAAAMGQISNLVRAWQWADDNPASVLESLGTLLHRLGWQDVASIVCLRWRTTQTGAYVEYSNAGHPSPFLRLPDGTVQPLHGAHTFPVGLGDPGPIRQEEMHLPAGSVVVLYTDGLVERRDRSLHDGLAALADALRDAPTGSAEQVRDHLLRVLVEDLPEDDVCLLVARCPD